MRFVAILLALCFHSSSLRSQFWPWSFAGYADLSSVGYGLEVDWQGNPVFIGGFDSTLFAFGSDTIYQKPLYVAKFSSGGKLLWMKGLPREVGLKTLTTDTLNNTYVAGTFKGPNVVVDGFSMSNSWPMGKIAIFLMKLDAKGDIVWIKSYGGVYIDEVASLHFDSEFNIIMSGWSYSDSLVLDSVTIINHYCPTKIQENLKGRAY